MIFCCDESNDLYRIVKNIQTDCARFCDPDDAVNTAKQGQAVLILADQYPKPTVKIDQGLLNTIHDKKLRIYIEYPQSLAGLELGQPTDTKFERVVTSSNFFAPQLKRLSILAQHGCWFLPAKVDSCHLAVATVAGYMDAEYGIPPNASPALFEYGSENILIALTKLSQFVTARYAPKASWKALWEKILLHLTGKDFNLDWQPTVGPRFAPDDELENDVEDTAFKDCFKWYRNHATYSIDKKKGSFEGYESIIDYMGRQFPRTWVRADCIAETAMVYACDWALNENPDSKRLATQMLDYVWSVPDFRIDEPNHPMYGLVRWFERGHVQYGDDNARVIMAGMTAARLLNDNRWDEHLLRCTIANLRTTGPSGFRCNAFADPDSFAGEKGWKYFWDNDPKISLAPHYQSYIWAVYLWVYELTGFDEMLVRSKKAIKAVMDGYPDKIDWTGGLTDETCHMILPLAYLARVDNDPQIKQWLDILVNDLVKWSHPCGAIREVLGTEGMGKYPPPHSNENYGTTEASLLHRDGDPNCDILYSYGYALIGLHEAFHATGDQKYRDLTDKMTQFLCRIQIRSTEHPYLNGTWMRGFDYELWEYYGSNADLGWGAWCVESGWYQAWIMAVLAMRKLGICMFDDYCKNSFNNLMGSMSNEMFDPHLGNKTGNTSTLQGDRPGAE